MYCIFSQYTKVAFKILQKGTEKVKLQFSQVGRKEIQTTKKHQVSQNHFVKTTVKASVRIHLNTYSANILFKRLWLCCDGN